MLKVILGLILLTPFISGWIITLNMLIILAFLWLIKIHHSFFSFNLSLMLATDYISYIMILLSIWITILMIYASQKIHKVMLFLQSLYSLMFFYA